MTRRWIAALLGVPLLLAAAWVLGGAVFNHTPVELGGVVVVSPAGDGPGAPAPPTGAPEPTGDPSAPPASPAAPPAEPPAPTGAIKVTVGPAPAAGDDDDDDDGIEDGGVVDDDTDS